MNKKMSKRQRDIKTKLMAAVAMLLVSSIMMVSTTYAWFTLSTAPEVTGINTAVGANGNLEMALLPKNGDVNSISSAVGDSVLATELKNVTWGNLVDLSDNSIYGLDKITLYPSALNLDDAGKLPEAMLKTPTYGADGRVDSLVANTFTGYYNQTDKNFAPDGQYGVRAVGTASGMTDRQLDYRNARSAANTAKAQAANLASASLNNNGSSLANIAIKYGMNSAGATFNAADIASLRAIVDDLQDADGVIGQLEKAYLQSILALAASAKSGTEDTAWTAVKGVVNAEGATVASVLATLNNNGVDTPAEITSALASYNKILSAVSTADELLAEMEETLEDDPDATFTWSEVRAAMEPLADPTAMRINGFLASEVKEKLGELVSSITSQGGLIVTMASGAGVYADIADQSGDFTASINIEKVEYNGIVLNDMSARMNTASTVTPSYLTAIGTAIETAGAPAGAGEGTMPISDMFGYVIDLAFRTNAAESNLLLQREAKDRIYSDNTNDQTMGHGATMTFASTTTGFSNDQVKALMEAIRIVFFSKDSGEIYTRAKLDVANSTIGTDGITAQIQLCDVVTSTIYVQATTGATHIADASAPGGYREAGEGDTATHVAVTAETGLTPKADDVILALTQNTPVQLSVLVYLDGNNIGNDDVAATVSQSMTGTMNLQFSSSAELVPMDYAALHTPGAETEPPAESQGE